jgi:hypothetical protein
MRRLFQEFAPCLYVWVAACVCVVRGEKQLSHDLGESGMESVFIIREREKIIPGGPGRRPL